MIRWSPLAIDRVAEIGEWMVEYFEELERHRNAPRYNSSDDGMGRFEEFARGIVRRHQRGDPIVARELSHFVPRFYWRECAGRYSIQSRSQGMGARLAHQEKQLMRCHTCGGTLEPVMTDLPFKLSQRAIVVIRDLPVLQCEACHEYVLEDPVMAQVDRILAGMAEGAELEVVRFAA